MDKEQQVISAIHRLAEPDVVEIESGLALIAVVGRGMKSAHGTAAKVFTALEKANINIRMIDQGSSELNIITAVDEKDFEKAIRNIYNTFIHPGTGPVD
jgi:aspartate kinase